MVVIGKRQGGGPAAGHVKWQGRHLGPGWLRPALVRSAATRQRIP